MTARVKSRLTMNLAEPWQYEFFRTGIAAATLAGALCGMIGVYVVLRHMSYVGHGLSHAIFGGAVASYAAGFNFYVGAGIWGVIAALLINGVARRRNIGADAAIGIITTASFAVGIALISRAGRFTRNFEAALFGNVLGITRTQVAVLGIVAIVTGALIATQYRQLLFVTFDPEVAPTYGVHSAAVEGVLALALAATIVTTMQVLGVTLIAAALVIPPISMRLLTDSFKTMLWGSGLMGAACGFAGMYLSYYADIASGATIVLVATAVFAVVYVYTAMRDRRRLRLLAVGQGPVQPTNDAISEVQ